MYTQLILPHAGRTGCFCAMSQHSHRGEEWFDSQHRDGWPCLYKEGYLDIKEGYLDPKEF
jgi:hypothetical protein